jgi:peroxiredoxin
MTDTRPAGKKAVRTERAAAAKATQQLAAKRRRLVQWGAGIAVATALTGGLYAVFTNATSNSTAGGGYQVGTPGIGTAAPGFSLASSSGGTMSLGQFKGRTVLLYFQEGLTCQPCWDQMTDLQKNAAQVKAAGIDQVLSITSDPANLIAQKVHDMNVTIPVLSDPNLSVSGDYHANSFGMMGNSRDGHTFVLVGPDGTIEWRADYGGAPKYTMYVAPATLLADLKAGEKK